MEQGQINYISEKIKFKLKNHLDLTKWINSSAKAEKRKIGGICYIFCSDNYLLKINKQYLKHSTFTDIITFDYSYDNIVSGDIFISIDRVKDNAKELGIHFETELHRVMIHGILHLSGYGDKTEKEEIQMRKLEDKYLKKIKNK